MTPQVPCKVVSAAHDVPRDTPIVIEVFVPQYAPIDAAAAGPSTPDPSCEVRRAAAVRKTATLVLVVLVHAGLLAWLGRLRAAPAAQPENGPVMMAYVWQSSHARTATPVQLRPLSMRLPMVRFAKPPMFNDSDAVRPSHEIALPITRLANTRADGAQLLITDIIAQDLERAREGCARLRPPPDSRTRRTSSTFLLRVEADGHVSDTRIESGSEASRADQALGQCLRSRALFTPRQIAGRTIPSWQRLTWP